jgi:GT2 family glycosyltransferase
MRATATAVSTAQPLNGSLGPVYVLLLNWNNWKDTNECLASLRALDYEGWKAIVLDNGSTDGSVQRIREKHPGVEIMELGENLGFAKGNNAGIRAALERSAEYVWVLNNDTTVDPKALRAMVEKAESDPKIGAVGSAIYSTEERERIQAWGGGHVNFLLGRSRHFSAPVSDEKLQFITGASLLVRRRALEELGLFDEGFFMYCEDADYCFRLRRAGWRLAVAGDSKVWHKEQGSVGRKSALLDTYFNRSVKRFFERNAPIPFIPIWAGTTLRIAKRVIAGEWKRVRAVWAGVSGRRLHHDGPEEGRY